MDIDNQLSKDDTKHIIDSQKAHETTTPADPELNNLKSIAQIAKSISPHIRDASITTDLQIDSKHNQVALETSVADDSSKQPPSSTCFDAALFRATMAIILFVIFYLTYLSDILTLLLLFLPQKGGGIAGCICDRINILEDCEQCWNCVWPTTDTSQCINFDKRTETHQLILLFLFGYTIGGWILIESSIWVRICHICLVYDRENIIYKQQREEEEDTFVKENNSQIFHINANPMTMTIKKKETLQSFDSNYHSDVMGLIPCCFTDIDKYHMKKVLMMNTEEDEVLFEYSFRIEDDSHDTNKKCCRFPGEIGTKCCEFPCFIFGISLSICWLFPFRYFWKIAVCDLSSAFWKRVCWQSLFHLVLFDGCWILFCVFTHMLMTDAQQQGINNYVQYLGPFVQRKAYCSFVMAILIIILWFTIVIYLMSTPHRKKRLYTPIRQ